MIDGEHRREHISGMAVLADIAGLYVGWTLTGRFSAIVAANAVATDVHVVEVGRQPAHG